MLAISAMMLHQGRYSHGALRLKRPARAFKEVRVVGEARHMA